MHTLFLKVMFYSLFCFITPSFSTETASIVVETDYTHSSLEKDAFSSDLAVAGVNKNSSISKSILEKLEKTSAGESVRKQILGDQNTSLTSIFEDRSISDASDGGTIKIDRVGALIGIGAITFVFMLILFISIYITRKVFRLIYPDY